MKILLAIDGSAHSMAAVQEIACRPFPPKTEVRILAVYEIAPFIMQTELASISQEYYAEADKYALKAATTIAEKAAHELHTKNPALTVSTTVVEGAPKSVILKEAETFGANLIVVGSHGYGAIERFLLGSVSQSVALHAKCSVEIVRK